MTICLRKAPVCTPESLFRQMSTEMDAGPDLWSNLTMGTCDRGDRGRERGAESGV